jgi:hypothetical protein
MRRVTRAFEVHTIAYLQGFDHRNRWFGVGRSLLGLGGLLTLLFTPIQALIVPVGNTSGANCSGIRSASMLCVGTPGDALEVRRWVMIAILVVVVIGYRPRWSALPHLWVTQHHVA